MMIVMNKLYTDGAKRGEIGPLQSDRLVRKYIVLEIVIRGGGSFLGQVLPRELRMRIWL